MFKERIYKIWKQFTTWSFVNLRQPVLCSKNEYTKSESNSQRWLRNNPILNHCVQRTNIQNLKAIHNLWHKILKNDKIVFKERIYKIWKQFTTELSKENYGYWLCSKNEYTKSESNSQPTKGIKVHYKHCVQRTNIQNLKAIHNGLSSNKPLRMIVFKERIYKIWKQFTTQCRSGWELSVLCSKNEYTKSESNSQLSALLPYITVHCVQRTNIQNLKAIHN